VELLAKFYVERTDPTLAKEIQNAHPLWGDNSNNLQIDHRGRLLRRDPIPFHPLLGWRYHQKAVFWGLLVSEEGFVLNSADDNSAFHDDAQVRVFILGGSTVAGAGASSNEKTIASRLERFLSSKLGKSVEVVNAGTGGWYSANEVSYLIHEILPFYKPNVVLILDGYNDSWRAVSAGHMLKPLGNGRYQARADFLIDPALASQRESWERFSSAGAGTLVTQWFANSGSRKFLNVNSYYIGSLLFGKQVPGVASQPEREITTPNGLSSLEANETECAPIRLDTGPYLSAIRSALGAADSAGIPILYALQPSIAYKQVLQPSEARTVLKVQAIVEAGSMSRYGAPPQTCFLKMQRRFFDEASSAFEQILPKSDKQFILSLADMFAHEKRDVFYDYAHYTDLGNQEIAHVLGEYVLKLIDGSERVDHTLP
jgi:hypothetical protein